MISNKKRLKIAFAFVRTNFFPRWDKDQQWSVRINGDLPGDGRCEDEIKTIHVRCVAKNRNDLHILLIHEISHAVAGGGHAKRWRARMLKAAQRAKRMGLNILEKMLDQEVEAYINDPITVRASHVYELISVAVLHIPEAKYGRILHGVAREFGLYPHELEKRFVRCRKIYDEAKREAALRLHRKSLRKNRINGS